MADILTHDALLDLATQIVRKQATILGASVAVRRARNVDGMQVDENGKVTGMPADPNVAMSELVEQYKTLSGAVGVDFCKQAAMNWLGSHPGAKLPPALL